ncbi:MAG: glycosyltransferase family 9 protein, partial [Bdellovibrionales bacterium]|nr:glycosyltransferase family 9 protein [Bdellovibrionales bacterium]
MERKKILLVRMDRIGDLVLTLPVAGHSALQNFDVLWLVNQGTEFVLESTTHPAVFKTLKKSFSISQFFQFVRWLKSERLDVSIVFHAPWWVGAALRIAGVPIRVGRKSQWHSFLFFNCGIRQSRKSGERHETEFNLELVDSIFGKSKKDVEPLPLVPQSLNWRWSQILESDEFFVVHPGMGGSALNWSHKRWIELIELLSEKSKVVLTGTESDSEWVDPIAMRFKDRKSVINLKGQANPKELLLLLSKSKAVIAPSTGVLHLSASLGVPTVGIFSKVPAERATRWGARGPRVFNLE